VHKLSRSDHLYICTDK